MDRRPPKKPQRPAPERHEKPKLKLQPRPAAHERKTSHARNPHDDRAPQQRERPDRERPARPRPARKEIKFYGVNACLALWRTRPQDVIRIYVLQELVKPLGEMLKWAAGARKAYHIVEAADLERLTESVHHQGVCVLAYEHTRMKFNELQQALREQRPAPWLIYLDGVENPHNLGAIIRSAAHFGASYVMGDGHRLPTLSPSACRIAEGGAEHVAVVALDDPLPQLRELQRQGYTLVAADVRGGVPVYDHAFERKTVLIVGAEEVGVSSRLRNLANVVVTIPGSTDVESLNVSVAFGVLASELFRQSGRSPDRGK